MKIALNGYGRMGRLIREKSLGREIEITAIIDPFVKLPEVTHSVLTAESIHDADVVIDFTLPDTAMENIKVITAAGKQAVIGTTGWYAHLSEAKALVKEAGTGLIWSGNFSLGVNVLFELVRYAGRIMNKLNDYDCFIHEYHHTGKADSPSGTAEMLGNILLEEIDRKETLAVDAMHRQIEADELHVSSTRGGSIPGTHSICFDSEVDTIELTHQARNREGFAFGALRAAEWIYGKTGFFTIENLMRSLIQ